MLHATACRKALTKHNDAQLAADMDLFRQLPRGVQRQARHATRLCTVQCRGGAPLTLASGLGA